MIVLDGISTEYETGMLTVLQQMLTKFLTSTKFLNAHSTSTKGAGVS